MTIVDSPTTEDTTHDDPDAEQSTAPRRAKGPGLNTETVAMASIFIAIFAFLAATFAIALAARAIDEHEAVAAGLAAAPSAPAVNVSLTEFAINPSSVVVPAGTSTIAVVNDGNLIHNLEIDGVVTPDLNGGDADRFDISELTPGVYVMQCDISGHAAAGMKGTITIS